MSVRHDVTSIGTAEAKRQFADVLGAVRHGGRRFVIERRGTPMAALVPLEDLDRLVARPGQGFLALVGAFEDAPDLPATLERIVRERPLQRKRPSPKMAR
jgi:prevent-host-death family protein